MQGSADKFVDSIIQMLVDNDIVDADSLCDKYAQLEMFRRECKARLLMHKLRIPAVYSVEE